MGHLKNTNFPFGIYGISMVLSVPILKHFRVTGIGHQIYLINFPLGTNGILFSVHITMFH